MWCLYISCQYILPKRINIPEREREKVVSGNYVRATLVFSCQLSHVHSPLLYKTQIQNLPKYRKFALVFSELFCFQRNRYQTVCELFSVPAKSTKNNKQTLHKIYKMQHFQCPFLCPLLQSPPFKWIHIRVLFFLTAIFVMFLDLSLLQPNIGPRTKLLLMVIYI